MLVAKRSLVAAVFLVLIVAGNTQAQIQIDPKHPQFIFDFKTEAMPDGSPRFLSLMKDSPIRQELELVDSQKEEIASIVLSVGVQNFEMSQRSVQSMLDGDVERAKLDLIEMKLNTDGTLEERIKDVLLPHQVIAFRRLSFEDHLMKNAGVIKRLNLTDEEEEEFLKKAREIKLQLEKEIAKLKREAAKELFSELPPGKKKILREKFGVENEEI